MNTDKPEVKIEDFAKYAEIQDAFNEKIRKETEELAGYLTKYKFCEPLKENTALTRKEKKAVLQALKKFNDKEAEELFKGDELEEMKKTKATIDGLTNDRKEVVFDELCKLRRIDEPSDLTIAEIYNFVDIIIGRTYNPRLYEGK